MSFKAIEAYNNCIVPGCTSTKLGHPHLGFFPIPQNKEEEWLTMINRHGLLAECRANNKCRGRYRICSLHFDDSMIALHRSLSANATPAFNLPEKSDSDNLFLIDKIVQTDENESFEKSRLWEMHDATFFNQQPLQVKQKRTISTQTGHEKVSYAEKPTQSSLIIVPSSVEITAPEIVEKPNSELICKDRNENQPFATETSGDFETTLTELSEWLKNIKKDLEDKTVYKKFALVLYFSCTPLYENIQKSLNLPTVSTLLKWNVDNMSCTINWPILNFYLSHKLTLMGNKSKYCILFLGAIDIKPHVYYNITKDEFVGLLQNKQKTSGKSAIKATKAYFMMLRGICEDWQQLINCFFGNEQQTNLQSPSDCKSCFVCIKDDTLKMLASVGFHVKTIVMDPNPYIYRYAKEVLKITSEKPYITFIESNIKQEVYLIFEPRELILHLRNLLLDNDFYNNNNVISWKYIKDLYLHKEKYKLSILPKLTKAHVFPDDQQKTDYKYAFEIFSEKICSTLEFYISLSLIPRDALPTARFIRSISFLIEIFSSNSVNHENELKCAFKMNKQQCSVLLYIQDLFKSLSIALSIENNTIKTDHIFDSVLITIHSLILLNNSLKSVGISHCMTKRFHGDPIDKLKKKTNNAFKGKVTAVKLLKILGNHFVRQLIRDNKFYNIPNNLNELYRRGKYIASSITELYKKPIHQSKRNALTTKSLNGDFDYQFQLPENRKFTYLSAYLFYKCYKKHRCCDIEREWRSMKSSDDLPWNDCLPLILKGNLRKPTPAFHEIVYHLEQSFLENFLRAKEKPLENLLNVLGDVSKKYEPICKCFPVNYLLLLFIRHRIYSVLIHNRNLSKQKSSDQLVLNKIINK